MLGTALKTGVIGTMFCLRFVEIVGIHRSPPDVGVAKSSQLYHERAAGGRCRPMAEAHPITEFVNLLVLVAVNHCDCEWPCGCMTVGLLPALITTAVKMFVPPQLRVDKGIVDLTHRAFPSVC
jgi:hypothetical protein